MIKIYLIKLNKPQEAIIAALSVRISYDVFSIIFVPDFSYFL